MLKEKLAVRIMCCVFCVMVAIVLGLASVSFAKYVNSVKSTPQYAGIAEMNCKYNIEKNGITFVNAPFQQQIGSSSGPVQMNAYSSATIAISNEGKNTGIDYQYGFVFYIPKMFASHALFQLLHLNGETAVHASQLYTFTNSLGQLDPEVSSVRNEYASLADSEEGKLDLFFNCSTLQIETTYSRTFSAFPFKGEYHGKVLCPFTIKKTENIEFCRVVLSLDATKYFLKEGQTERFALRVVPLSELNGDEIATPWNSSEYKLQKPTTTASGYDVSMNEDGTIDVVYTDENEETVEYKDVYITDCIGVTFPSRINVLFSQKEK